jgi:hypothetical protein
VLHVDAATEGASAGPAVFECAIECGDRAVDLSAETTARLACDAAVVVLRRDATGSTVDAGRKTRTVPPAIRRALEARDTGCRFPGCTARRCDAHHIVHWGEGGPTCLDNLVLLCRHHHRLLHEGGYTVHVGDGRAFTFVNARGRVVETAPAAPAWASRCSNIRSVPVNTPAVWDGTPFNLGYVIDVLRGSEPIPSRSRAM